MGNYSFFFLEIKNREFLRKNDDWWYKWVDITNHTHKEDEDIEWTNIFTLLTEKMILTHERMGDVLKKCLWELWLGLLQVSFNG